MTLAERIAAALEAHPGCPCCPVPQDELAALVVKAVAGWLREQEGVVALGLASDAVLDDPARPPGLRV